MQDVARANAAGFIAMALWSTMAALVTLCAGIPPLLMASITSITGFVTFLVFWMLRGDNLRERFTFPARIIALAAIGIGGYRLLYFYAFAYAPPVEANLINFLWPVLIVLFSSSLPGEKLRWYQITGALLGFAGIALLLMRHGNGFVQGIGLGHMLAFAAAIIWAAFSVISRTTKGYSSNVVPVSFLITSVVMLSVFLATNEAPVTRETLPWVIAVLLGVMAGLGYFLWDVGMKHGSIQLLAVSSYFVPLVSTGILMIFGKAPAHPAVFAAAGLVFLGSCMAAKDKLIKKGP